MRHSLGVAAVSAGVPLPTIAAAPATQCAPRESPRVELDETTHDPRPRHHEEPPRWPLWAVRHEDTLTWVEAPNATTTGAFAADRLVVLDRYHTVTLEVVDPDAPGDRKYQDRGVNRGERRPVSQALRHSCTALGR